MFDIGSAVILGLVLMGLIDVARTLVEGPNKSRIQVAVVIVVCAVTVLLVAASDFAHEQVVLNRPLDSLNFASQMVIVVLLIGLASAAWKGIKAVSNIGQNAP
jgi:uncharacterized membrane protein